MLLARASSHHAVPAAAPAADGDCASSTRLRSPEVVSEALDELANEQLTLAMSLPYFLNASQDLPYDLSTRAAAHTLRERLADVESLRDALAAIHADCVDPRLAALLGPDAPLTEYVRGLYAWSKAVVRAFEELSLGLRAFCPNWTLLRSRLEDAASFYFAELEGPIRNDLALLHARTPELLDPCDPLHDLDGHVEELNWVASYLARSLQKRFG